MSPYQLRIILSLHVTPDWKRFCGLDQSTDTWLQTISELREMGLIDNDEYPTDRLTAFVNAICATPLPIKKWVMPKAEDLP